MLVLENDKPFIYLPLFYLNNESFEKSTESSNMHIYIYIYIISDSMLKTPIIFHHSNQIDFNQKLLC